MRNDALDHRPQREGLHLQRDTAGFDAGEGLQIVDQPLQPADFLVHVGERLRVAGKEAVHQPFQIAG